MFDQHVICSFIEDFFFSLTGLLQGGFKIHNIRLKGTTFFKEISSHVLKVFLLKISLFKKYLIIKIKNTIKYFWRWTATSGISWWDSAMVLIPAFIWASSSQTEGKMERKCMATSFFSVYIIILNSEKNFFLLFRILFVMQKI